MTQRRASVVVARGYEPDSGHAVDAGEVARRFAAAVLARRSRVLAVIATSLVRRVLWCGSLIGWFLRSIRCSGLAWRLGSSSTMPRLRPAVIASKVAAGWLRWEESDLVEAGTSRVGV